MSNTSDQNIFQRTSEIFIQFIQLSCTTSSVFIAAKLVAVIVYCFYKHWAWNRLVFLFEYLIRKHCWNLTLIQMFNYRKCFLDEFEIYLIIYLLPLQWSWNIFHHKFYFEICCFYLHPISCMFLHVIDKLVFAQ